jgi:hypothetical protein
VNQSTILCSELRVLCVESITSFQLNGYFDDVFATTFV